MGGVPGTPRGRYGDAVRIVVTGCAGRIGRAIVRRLAGEHDVVGVDRIAAPGVDRVADILDRGAMAAACEGAGAIIHVAALHAPHVGVLADAEFERGKRCANSTRQERRPHLTMGHAKALHAIPA